MYSSPNNPRSRAEMARKVGSLFLALPANFWRDCRAGLGWMLPTESL